MGSTILTDPPPSLEGGDGQADGEGHGPILQTRAAQLEAERVFSPEALGNALNRLADAGWNTVVIPGFLNGYSIFPSSVWGEYGLQIQHPGFKKWNPFEVAFDVAWRRGLDVILSLKPYLVETAPGQWRRPPIPRKYPSWLAKRHPNRKRRLSETVPGRTYYCPVNPEFRRFQCDTLHVLLEDYPFHGLLVDLRHYPFYSGGKEAYTPWCYCGSCRKKTLRDLGFDPAGVDFKKELPMVRRWKEWQAQQMDQALAYIRMRVLKARGSMRILGLLTTDSGLGDQDERPLIHWKTWVERALVEALVLDKYPPDLERFTTQVREDIRTLSNNALLIPMLPRLVENGNDFLPLFASEPLPGFISRFNDWDLPDFDPLKRVRFESQGVPSESDPIGGICMLFEQMAEAVPQEKEFIAFLEDLQRILTRGDVGLSVDRLMMVVRNIRGLRQKVSEGEMEFGLEQDRILHDLDLAVRLAYLAGCDLVD